MKVILNKEVKLYKAIVYLRLIRTIERKDIQEYLKGKRFDYPLIEIRVKEYLKSIGVFDEKYQLTYLGNYVKETGLLTTFEEGKCLIWFTNKDSYFGNKIFYFKRVQPSKESNLEKLNIEFNNSTHFYLPTENNSFSELLTSNVYFGEILHQQDIIKLSWVWENLDKSYFEFNGKLEISEKNKINIKSTPIPVEDNLKSIIENIVTNWDKKYERQKVYFDEISIEDRFSFETNFTTKWKDFDIQLEKVPLMPYNLEEAKKWRDWLLLAELKKNYLSPSDFKTLVNEINEKDAFKAYSNGLDIPKTESFHYLLKKDPISFWHFYAPLDLNPNTKTIISAEKIQLKRGDKITFREIVNKLGIEKIDNSVCIYYDRYIIKERQQKKAAALLESINCKNKIIITDTSSEKNCSDFIKKNKPEINIIDYISIFKSHYPHDRYLIIGNKDKIQVWNISNSIDFIFFPDKDKDKDIDMNTPGEIRNSVVFTLVSKDILDKEFLNFIKNKIENGK
jgi:hypothetical protein